MKKKTYIALLAVLITGFFPYTVLATDNWEMNITVSSGNAANRLSLGQNHDATDQRDGLYDVPAMLAGTLRAWFASADTTLWRDIRSSAPGNSYEWRLLVTSRTGVPIMISWDPQQLPTGPVVKLFDNATDTVIDMASSSSYLLEESSEAELLIKIN